MKAIPMSGRLRALPGPKAFLVHVPALSLYLPHRLHIPHAGIVVAGSLGLR
jgi:hypothetical protein